MPWVESGVGSGCVGEGGNEIGCPGAFPEVFPVWAVGEACAEGSAEVGGLQEEVFLVLFRMGEDLAEV